MLSLMRLFSSALFPVAAILLSLAANPTPVAAHTIAYDDARNHVIHAKWTNGTHQSFGFTPWAIVTSGPDFHGTYDSAGTNPLFVIATPTNVLGTNYADVWGTYANGTSGTNSTVVYRGFANPLGTNTF